MQSQDDDRVQDECCYIARCRHGGMGVSGYGATEEEAAALLHEWAAFFQRANGGEENRIESLPYLFRG